MPSRPDEFVAHCLELFGRLGACRARRMFGGHGLYVDDLFIAIIARERLYLKVDAVSLPAFEAAGCAPFTYDAKGKPMTMAYWTAPDEALESPELMAPWGRRALDAALRAALRAKVSREKKPARLKPVAASQKKAKRR